MDGELFTGEVKAIELRPWQEEAVEELRDKMRRGVKRQVLSAPTGSGKTIIATFLLEEAYKKRSQSIFVCDRTALIHQTSRVFDDYGIAHGVIQADHWRRQPWQRIQVGSAQTLSRRGWPDDTKLIVVDEAHTFHKNTLERIGRGDVYVIGLTATPFTRGMGLHYESVTTVRTTQQLIDAGYLAPYRIFAPSEPDMTGAKTVGGEWTDKEAEARSIPIVGDIVTEYLRHADGKKFIAFGATVAHCEEIQRQMLAAGIVCSLYTYRNTDSEREETLKEFAKSDSYIRGLISVGALAKGFDSPAVECVIMARPLRKSLAEHIQIMGRGLRADSMNPEKTCIILDHAGNCKRFYSDMMDFFANGASTLDDGTPRKKSEATKKEVEPLQCPKCKALHNPRPSCPECGHEYPRKTNVVHVAGELSELTGLPDQSTEHRQSFYSQLLYIQQQRNYNPNFARAKYRDRFGIWPSQSIRNEATMPTLATLNWVRSELIRYAKRRK